MNIKMSVRNETEAYRDEWGILHILAGSSSAAYRSLGYFHAQDRLWQMEMLWRKGVGRWSEWIGSAGLESDKLARRLFSQVSAIRDYEGLGDEARNMLQNYADGVNAFIDEDHLSLEFEVLEAKPLRWEPWYSIVVMRHASVMMGATWMKLFRAAAIPAIGPEGAAKLRYDDGGNERICMPPISDVSRWPIAISKLQEEIREILEAAPVDASGGGSNNFAVSGDMTASGLPIMAGDPHRELDVPTIYMQTHLACDEFDVIGITMPGVPGFPHFGHNASVAWGVTVAFVDAHDVYIEKFRNNGAECLTCDGWASTIRASEEIVVKGESSVLIETCRTSNGPVFVGDPASGSALSVRSMQYTEMDRSFDCMPRMLRANTVSELYEATRGWGLVDHNLVSADKSGNIGYRVRALVPDRPRENGWLPVPGWDKRYKWKGMIPFEDMPFALNPSGHMIVTANNRVAAEQEWPYLSTDCHPPHRARRLTDRLLELGNSISPDCLQPVFGDVLSLPAQLFQKKLGEISPATEASKVAHRCLLDWDCTMSGASVEASLYSLLRLAVTRKVTELCGISKVSTGSLREVDTPAFILTQMWWVVPTLLRDDDTSFLAGKQWTDVFQEALEQVATDEVSTRTWASIHTPLPRHPLSASHPNIAPLLDPHCSDIGGDCDTVLATGYLAGAGFRATYSSLTRYIFDLSDWNNSQWVVYQGASGRADSPHRSDQNALWASLKMIPMHYDWEGIRRDATRLDTPFNDKGGVLH